MVSFGQGDHGLPVVKPGSSMGGSQLLCTWADGVLTGQYREPHIH